MNEQEQRIAIAEACGWQHVEFEMGWPPYPDYDRTINGNGMLPLPNYLNDLNAMHEAEKKLSRLQCEFYDSWLERFTDEISGYSWQCTAAERAEAFLRTIGKSGPITYDLQNHR